VRDIFDFFARCVMNFKLLPTRERTWADVFAVNAILTPSIWS
jgi:hypothetical protein